MVCVTDPYGRILGFVDRSCDSELYSRGSFLDREWKCSELSGTMRCYSKPKKKRKKKKMLLLQMCDQDGL
jgi:hypothetical protein